jgi:hypothetical protein
VIRATGLQANVQGMKMYTAIQLHWQLVLTSLLMILVDLWLATLLLITSAKLTRAKKAAKFAIGYRDAAIKERDAAIKVSDALRMQLAETITENNTNIKQVIALYEMAAKVAKYEHSPTLDKQIAEILETR